MSERKSNLISVNLFDLYLLLGGEPHKPVKVSRKWYEEVTEEQDETAGIAKQIRGRKNSEAPKPKAPSADEASQFEEKDEKDLDNEDNFDEDTPTRDAPITKWQ